MKNKYINLKKIYIQKVQEHGLENDQTLIEFKLPN